MFLFLMAEKYVKLKDMVEFFDGIFFETGHDYYIYMDRT